MFLLRVEARMSSREVGVVINDLDVNDRVGRLNPYLDRHLTGGRVKYGIRDELTHHQCGGFMGPGRAVSVFQKATHDGSCPPRARRFMR